MAVVYHNVFHREQDAHSFDSTTAIRAAPFAAFSLAERAALPTVLYRFEFLRQGILNTSAHVQERTVYIAFH
jgi:hypothetical protein